MPPLNQPPLKGDLAYGIGLGKDHGWIGHNGELPGYNTYLFYHPDLDAVVVVEVNSDISSGKCPKDVPTMKEWPRERPLRVTGGPDLRSACLGTGQALASAARDFLIMIPSRGALPHGGSRPSGPGLNQTPQAQRSLGSSPSDAKLAHLGDTPGADAC